MLLLDQDDEVSGKLEELAELEDETLLLELLKDNAKPLDDALCDTWLNVPF